MFLCFESNATNEIETHAFRKRKSAYDLSKIINLGANTKIEV